MDRLCNVDNVLAEIKRWKSELDEDIVDNIIYETLQTVEDIINEECYS